jgi:hypothetical protein
MLIRRATLTLALMACCSTALAQGVTPFCDLLYWRASEETSAVWSDVVPVTMSSFSAETLHFDWSPGFRVGVSCQADADAWDVKLYWTNFRTSQQSAAGGFAIVTPEFFSGIIGGNHCYFNVAQTDWTLTYNTIDLELGRKITFGEAAWLRPSIGIKAAIIKQDVQTGLADLLLDIVAEESVTHDFWGLGPSFGLDGGWTLPRCHNLSLVGSCAVDFLFGQWNVKDSYLRIDNNPELGAYHSYDTSMKDSSLGVPALRCFVGLQWAYQGRIAITAQAGYEVQWWANQQRLLMFQQLPMHGDLTLEGLTCGVSLGY